MAEKSPARFPKNGKVKTSIQVEEVTLRRMKVLAKKERRTVSGLVEVCVEERYTGSKAPATTPTGGVPK